MPGNSPSEAVENFVTPIKDALSCLGDSAVIYRDHPPLDTIQTLTLNGGEGLEVPVDGDYAPKLLIEVEMSYLVIHCPDDEDRGPYRCTTCAYILRIKQGNAELMSFHWHPGQNVSPERLPHFHVGESRLPQMQTLHIPTPRVSVEEFIQTTIEAFGVRPTVDEKTWRELLDSTLGPHREYRSWSERYEAPYQDGVVESG